MVCIYYKERNAHAKTTRKDLLNAPDEFISTTRSAVKWIKENPSRFAVAVAIIVVVLASGVGFYSGRWTGSTRPCSL
jgi:membrane protein DedA with SNARE-associated domain